MIITSYRDLDAWKLGMDFVVAVYDLTRRFPREELYGLTSQVRRAAVAVPSNISEGHQQGGRVYMRYVGIALGSVAEAETQLELAGRLHYVTTSQLEPVAILAGDLRRVLFGLRRALRRRQLEALTPDP